MAGNIKTQYVASVTQTVTNLQSLDSSQDYLAGWSSAFVVNTSNCYEDYLYGFKFTTHASNRQAGFINIYVIASLNDTPTWPASASGTPGTEGALTFTDTEERDSICLLVASRAVDSSASAVIDIPQFGIAQFFGGRIPSHHCIYVSQNCTTTTTDGLASSGNAVYYTAQYSQYT